ncbi:MAG: SRPBCC family protein [candidate division KSB1 bacterium]|jgi:ligand-binding SRPBCC domain-containing protein|nr:SRPBCC family protein [candidate division KSB1 bacterium]
MKKYILETETILDMPLDEVFPFFADAHNLNRVTPPWLNFEIISDRDIEMQVGTQVQYRLKLHSIPVRWQSEITEWDPPYKFTDTQIQGPYRLWIHEHIFASEADKTIMRDRVTYAVPGRIFAQLIHSVFVKRDLDRIFSYREEVFKRIFSAGNRL